ncbi:MAG: acyl-CoA thioesterase [Clostridia bacterium]
MNEITKRVRDSYTEQVQILTQSTMNGFNRLFGGQLMQWIDVVAAVVARRHANRNVTTASIDQLTFEGAAHSNDTLVLKGHITYAGRTSMEVCVRTYVEQLSGELQLINTAYLVLVALDGLERPTQVPGLILETENEKAEYEQAKRRYDTRKAHRAARG